MHSDELNTDNVLKAADILNLNGRESLADIKKKHRNLVKEWHPDQCKTEKENCSKKIEEISWAYQIIKEYCDNYLYSFRKTEILKNLPRDIQNKEKLKRQFGNDPLWGK